MSIEFYARSKPNIVVFLRGYKNFNLLTTRYLTDFYLAGLWHQGCFRGGKQKKEGETCLLKKLVFYWFQHFQ